MTLSLGAMAPDFSADTTQGPIRFHDWMGKNWCLFFTHPKDFTPVCTTELAAMAHAAPEFERRGVKIIGLSVDPVETHRRWVDDIASYRGLRPNYPIIGDPDLAVSKLYQMLPESAEGGAAGRTAMDNATARCVYVIDPDKRIRLTITYPMTTGRDVTEMLRVIDSLLLTANHKVATPAGWQQGDDVIIVPAVSDEEARCQHPAGWHAPLPYMRVVSQPA